MTPEEALKGLNRLKISYHGMKPLDELTQAAYVQEIMTLRWDDFAAGATVIVRNSKFFPSIAEILEAADNACRKRLEAQDHVEREERLALQAGEDKIMDAKSEVHRVVVGPNHQKFLDMLSGKIKLPEPEWVTRSARRTKLAEQAKELTR